jgi:uncharacterized protein (DUF362 family)
MNRRQFLQSVIAAALPAALGDYDFLKSYDDYRCIRPVRSVKLARVVSFTDPLCVSRDFTINDERASRLLRAALLEYTRKPAMALAVRSLFPKFHEGIRVSIKINTASWYMPTHRVLAETMAACLVEGGVKPDNIIIWERAEDTLTGAGYAIKNVKGAVKTIATDTPGYGYDESKSYRVNGASVYLTSILTRHSDYLINLGVLKHHFLAGVTTAMKNLYGVMPLLDRPLLAGPVNLLKFHINACEPSISELNAVIADKIPTALYVCDGLLGMYNDGPWGTPQWAQNEIILSDDPVALDTLSLYRIEKMRRDVGLPPVMNKALFLRRSAAMGLGTNDPKNMDITVRVL